MLQSTNKFVEVLGEMNGQIKSLEKRLEELETEREEIIRKMSELSPLRGCIEYKPVKNKIGKKYYYFYLRRLENGRLRSIYLGREIPEWLMKAANDREKLRAYKQELKRIEKQIKSIEKMIRKNVRENKNKNN